MKRLTGQDRAITEKWRPATQAIRGGTARSHFGETSEAIFLATWGALVVGTVDNFIRPRLCGSRMALHPLLVFLSMFGGVAVFGMMGLLVGPLIASLFMAMVRIYRRDFLGLRSPTPAAPLPPPGGVMVEQVTTTVVVVSPAPASAPVEA